MKEIFAEAETKMKHAVEHLHAELKRLRTGRASLGLLEPVMVDYFGTPTPLKQVATLTVVDATMLMAQPWDAKQIPAIERAIHKAELGLNPTSDGKVVRIPVPQPTEERRKELVRKAHELAEQARTGIRAARPRRQRQAQEEAQGPRAFRGRRAPRARRGAEDPRPRDRRGRQDPGAQGEGDPHGLSLPARIPARGARA